MSKNEQDDNTQVAGKNGQSGKIPSLGKKPPALVGKTFANTKIAANAKGSDTYSLSQHPGIIKIWEQYLKAKDDNIQFYVGAGEVEKLYQYQGLTIVLNANGSPYTNKDGKSITLYSTVSDSNTVTPHKIVDSFIKDTLPLVISQVQNYNSTHATTITNHLVIFPHRTNEGQWNLYAVELTFNLNDSNITKAIIALYNYTGSATLIAQSGTAFLNNDGTDEIIYPSKVSGTHTAYIKEVTIGDNTKKLLERFKSKTENNTSNTSDNLANNMIEDKLNQAKILITDTNSLDNDKKRAADTLCEIVRKTLDEANGNIFSQYFQFAAGLLREPSMNYSTAAHLIKGLSSILIGIEQDDRSDLSILKHSQSLDLIEDVTSFLAANAYSKYLEGPANTNNNYQQAQEMLHDFCAIIQSLTNITKNMPDELKESGADALERAFVYVKTRFNDILYSTGSYYDQEYLQEFFISILTTLPLQDGLEKIADILFSAEEAKLMITLDKGTVTRMYVEQILSKPQDRHEIKFTAIHSLATLAQNKEAEEVEKALPALLEVLVKSSLLLDLSLKKTNPSTETSTISAISTIIEAIFSKKMSFDNSFEVAISLLKHPWLNSSFSSDLVQETVLNQLGKVIQEMPKPIAVLVYIELLKELAYIHETTIKVTIQNFIKNTINSTIKLETPLSNWDSLQKALDILEASLIIELKNTPELYDGSDVQGNTTPTSSSSNNELTSKVNKQKLLELLKLCFQLPADDASVSCIAQHESFAIIKSSNHINQRWLKFNTQKERDYSLPPITFFLRTEEQVVHMIDPNLSTQHAIISDSTSSTVQVAGAGQLPTLDL